MRARFVLPVVVLALSVSGCGGGSSSSAAAQSSAVRASDLAAVAAQNRSPAVAGSRMSASSSGTSTSAGKTAALVDAHGNPIVPAAAKAHTDAGAIAFTKYYIALLDASDSNPFLFKDVPLGAPGCSSCRQLNSLLHSQQSQHIHLSNNGTSLTGFVVQTSPDTSQKVVSFMQRKFPSVKQVGNVRTRIPGGQFYTRLLVIWKAGGWKVGQMGSDPA